MNRKLTPLILATLVALSLTGCSGGTIENDEPKPVSMFIRHKLGEGYSVLEERGTGVCYLVHDGVRQYSLIIMLNPDGTPRTWSEMEGQDEKAKSE